MNQEPTAQQIEMQVRLDARCEKRRDKKKQMTPFWSLGQELVLGVRQHWNFGSAVPPTLVVEDTGIWLAEFLLRKQRNETTVNLWFASSFALDVEWVHERGCNSVLVCYNKSIKQFLAYFPMGLVFDCVLGNLPYDGKSSIHLKAIGLLKAVSKENCIHGHVLPTNIFMRDLDRMQKHTAWLDDCSLVRERDCGDSFPSVSDKLSAFMFKVDGGRSFPNRSAKISRTFKASRIVGIDFHQCAKKPTEDKVVPLVSGVAEDGSPLIGKRFTTVASLKKKLGSVLGKPTLHVNTAGSMVKRANIAWLDETGQHGWYRQGCDSYVFESLEEARSALAFFKSDEGKEFIAFNLEGAWALGPMIRKLFRS